MVGPYLTFASLDAHPGFRSAFLLRVPRIDVSVEKEEALARLSGSHEATRATLGLGDIPLQTAEQVHGNEVAFVDRAAAPIPGADALITNSPAICLGIYVADCAAVYFVDPKNHAIGLAHSGKKGTELEIVPATLRAMNKAFGSRPEEITVQIAPCIRPPDYEIDFAARIRSQARDCGVTQVFDGGENTAADLKRFYSYRIEKGKTGRMLALLAMRR